MDALVNETSTVCDDGLSVGSGSNTSSSANDQSIVEVVLVLDQSNTKRRITLPISISEVILSNEPYTTDEFIESLLTELELSTQQVANLTEKVSKSTKEVANLTEEVSKSTKEVANLKTADARNRLRIILLQRELAKKNEQQQEGDSNDAVSSGDVLNGVDSTNASGGSSSDAYAKFVDATNKFFTWARQELQGGTDEESTFTSLIEENVSLSTQDAEAQINQATNVVLEISAQVVHRISKKVGETTGLDAEFLAKMAKKYRASHETLTHGGK